MREEERIQEKLTLHMQPMLEIIFVSPGIIIIKN
jgi:hypothetical protein